jgi:hypothetical protein
MAAARNCGPSDRGVVISQREGAFGTIGQRLEMRFRIGRAFRRQVQQRERAMHQPVMGIDGERRAQCGLGAVGGAGGPVVLRQRQPCVDGCRRQRDGPFECVTRLVAAAAP